MKSHNILYSLAEMIFGVGLFEITGKLSLNFEQNSLGTSPIYLVFITLGGIALFLFLHGAVKVWKSAYVKEDLNIFTEQQ